MRQAQRIDILMRKLGGRPDGRTIGDLAAELKVVPGKIEDVLNAHPELFRYDGRRWHLSETGP